MLSREMSEIYAGPSVPKTISATTDRGDGLQGTFDLGNRPIRCRGTRGQANDLAGRKVCRLQIPFALDVKHQHLSLLDEFDQVPGVVGLATPHISLIPAGVMFLTVLSFNLVGDVLRRRFADVRAALL